MHYQKTENHAVYNSFIFQLAPRSSRSSRNIGIGIGVPEHLETVIKCSDHNIDSQDGFSGRTCLQAVEK